MITTILKESLLLAGLLVFVGCESKGIPIVTKPPLGGSRLGLTFEDGYWGPGVSVENRRDEPSLSRWSLTQDAHGRLIAKPFGEVGGSYKSVADLRNISYQSADPVIASWAQVIAVADKPVVISEMRAKEISWKTDIAADVKASIPVAASAPAVEVVQKSEKLQASADAGGTANEIWEGADLVIAQGLGMLRKTKEFEPKRLEVGKPTSLPGIPIVVHHDWQTIEGGQVEVTAIELAEVEGRISYSGDVGFKTYKRPITLGVSSAIGGFILIRNLSAYDLLVISPRQPDGSVDIKQSKYSFGP